MEGGGVSPAMALTMISEGREQVIQVDHRTMLRKVMEALGAREAPEYTVFACGSRGVRVSIKLNVSCAKYSVGQKLSVVVVEGDTTQSRMLAEKTAILKAFNHLNEKHLIRIRDFSSRVAHDLEGGSAFGYLNAAVYNVEQLIDKWQVVMDKCDSITMQVGAKEGAAKVDGDSDGQGEVYGALKETMEMMMDMYKGQITQARTRTKEIESERKRYHTRSTEKYHTGLRKGYLQDVFLEAKQVLDYVLTYLGSGRATYTNGPTDEGMMEGVVVFKIPDLPGVEYCGNLTIRGKSTRSRDVEENAAFRALLYMEKKFNLKIVDLNHAERVEAEKEQKLLVRLLDQIVAVGDDVKKYWGKMSESIATEKSAYAMGPQALYAAPDGVKKAEAYKLCAKCVEELDKESTKRYDDCAFWFDELQKLEYHLEEIKTTLDMD